MPTFSTTILRYRKILNSKLRHLWTGGGVHYIQPQQIPVLEKLDKFSKFDETSRKFLHFEAQLLTDGKCDPSHLPSFNNMLLRIPGTLNSKAFTKDEKDKIIDIPYDARVRIEKPWDGNTPIVEKLLLMKYYNWLQFTAIRYIQEQRTREAQ